MQNMLFRPILTAAVLSLAAPATAQDTTAEPAADAEQPAAEAETPAATDAAADEAESTGESDAEAPEAADTATPPNQPEVMEVVRDTFGDWEVRCSPEGDECFLYQLAVDSESNPVAEFSVLKLPAGNEAVAGATVVSPLGTLLPEGVRIQIDSGEARQYPFAWCSQVGCFSRFALAQTSIDAMKRGRAGKVTLVSVGAPDQPVVLDLSLSGFTAAYDSLEVPVAPAE